MSRFLIAMWMTFTLAACGGGGNGTSSQTLSFMMPGPMNLFVGDTFSNPAGGLGTGVVTYSSSDTSIATVDENGVVTVLVAGSVEIRADKAADKTYRAVHASYDVKSIETRVEISAWVGVNDTQVSFPATAAGLEFYRSSAPNCDISNYTGCPDGQMDILSSAAAAHTNSIVVRDTAATLSRAGYYFLKHGVSVASLVINAATFSGRRRDPVVVFKSRPWLSGGFDRSAKQTDGWRPSDGLDWRIGLRQTFNFH